MDETPQAPPQCEPFDGSPCDQAATSTAGRLCAEHLAAFARHVSARIDQAEIDHLDDPDLPTLTP